MPQELGYQDFVSVCLCLTHRAPSIASCCGMRLELGFWLNSSFSQGTRCCCPPACSYLGAEGWTAGMAKRADAFHKVQWLHWHKAFQAESYSNNESSVQGDKQNVGKKKTWGHDSKPCLAGSSCANCWAPSECFKQQCFCPNLWKEQLCSQGQSRKRISSLKSLLKVWAEVLRGGSHSCAELAQLSATWTETITGTAHTAIASTALRNSWGKISEKTGFCIKIKLLQMHLA